MAKKTKIADKTMQAAQLKSFKGFIAGNEAFGMEATTLRKLWMVPALKAVYAESTHPVDGTITISKINMDNFLLCEFVQLEDDVKDQIAADLASVSAASA